MKRHDLRVPCVHGRYEPHMTRELPTAVSNESLCSAGRPVSDAELAEMGYVNLTGIDVELLKDICLDKNVRAETPIGIYKILDALLVAALDKGEPE